MDQRPDYFSLLDHNVENGDFDGRTVARPLSRRSVLLRRLAAGVLLALAASVLALALTAPFFPVVARLVDALRTAFL